MDRVLAYYGKWEVPLSYRPVVRYIDKPNPLGRDSIAMVNTECELDAKITAFYVENIALLAWRECYGLQVSVDAIDEFRERIDVVGREGHKVPELMVIGEEGAHIFLFKSYRRYSSVQEVIDRFFVHEVWHLIEDQQGLMESHPMIREGTATFAVKHFAGIDCETSIESARNYGEMVYSGVANLVQGFVKSSPNPYKAMLDPALRQQMQDAAMQRILPRIAAMVNASPSDQQGTMRHLLGALGEHRHFLEGEIDRDKVIGFFRSVGADKLVAEVEHQDLGKLVEWFRVLFARQEG